MMFKVELSIKRCNTDSEHACCFFARALFELQRQLDVFPLLISNKVVQMLADLPLDFWRCFGGIKFMEDVWRQILKLDSSIFAECACPLDGIFKLAHISRPSVTD